MAADFERHTQLMADFERKMDVQKEEMASMMADEVMRKMSHWMNEVKGKLREIEQTVLGQFDEEAFDMQL